ncbi:LysE family transporter [Kamptonema cortianum]|nr:LysE family transporter [Geitlerinema splendidum]MDK3160884.1 LysE family transporter [Kamptonema cortianum]
MLFPLLFFKGLLIGFLIAAPVGPIGILCIRRTLSGRYLLGLATGLGAGVADTFYGAVAGFSLAAISDFIDTYNVFLRLVGGILLAWLGVYIYRAPPRHDDLDNGSQETLFHGFMSAFFLTISNPVTLLVFAAAFAAVGVSTANDSFAQSLTLVTGVFFWSDGLVVFIKHRGSPHAPYAFRYSIIVDQPCFRRSVDRIFDFYAFKPLFRLKLGCQ